MDVRWGLTVPFAGVPLADHGELYRRIEAAGYDDLWTSETAGYDGFTPLALAAERQVARRRRLASGVEREPSGRAGARVVEVPRHLGAGPDLGHLDPARQRQRDLRQRERPPEAFVSFGDALERVVHGTADPTRSRHKPTGRFPHRCPRSGGV